MRNVSGALGVVLCCAVVASANPEAHFPRLTISWQPIALSASLPLEGYTIYRACDGKGLQWSWLARVAPEQRTYQDTALLYGQRCCYKVYARYLDRIVTPAKGRKKSSVTEPPQPTYKESPAIPEQCAETPPEPPLPGVEGIEVK